MPTTIQLSEANRDALRSLKREDMTYDEVVTMLLRGWTVEEYLAHRKEWLDGFFEAVDGDETMVRGAEIDARLAQAKARAKPAK